MDRYDKKERGFSEMKLPNTKTVMGVPTVCFWMIVVTCVVGIVIGSFFDFAISEKLADVTDI